MYVIVPNLIKLGQTDTELSRYFDFQDDGRPPS